MKKISFLLLILAFSFFAGRKIWRHFHVPDMPLNHVDLSTETGEKLKTETIKQPYLLVSYFQSWCGDCIREAPSIEALQKSLGKEKLEVILISDEDWTKIKRFSSLSKTNLPVYQCGTSLEDLGIHIYPTTWLLGPDRQIMMVKQEGFDWNSEEVIKLIQKN